MAAVLLGFLLLMHGPIWALALTGGAIGGGSFSSPGSSSSSSKSFPSSSSSTSSGFLYYNSNNAWHSSSFSVIWVIIGLIGAAIVFVLVFIACSSKKKKKREKSSSFSTSVLKLQVGLLGSAATIQTDLNRIAETADTSSSLGWSNILAGATRSLLQNLDYCISGYSSVALNQTMQDAEKNFNQLSQTERHVCDKETLVNVNHMNLRDTTSRKACTGSQTEYITVTILVATRGMCKLPEVDDRSTLKQALENLKSIPSNKILSVLVLWTPQEEDDNLSEEQLLKKYPLLKPFKDYPLVEIRFD